MIETHATQRDTMKFPLVPLRCVHIQYKQKYNVYSVCVLNTVDYKEARGTHTHKDTYTKTHTYTHTHTLTHSVS